MEYFDLELYEEIIIDPARINSTDDTPSDIRAFIKDIQHNAQGGIIRVMFVEKIHGEKARLGIDAPFHVPVRRGELHEYLLEKKNEQEQNKSNI